MVRILQLVIILFTLHDLEPAWVIFKRPPSYDKINIKSLSTNHFGIRKKIVAYHNFFRSKVSPPAANMLKMTWHNGTAKLAQAWAEQCHQLVHDANEDRVDPMYGTCGQNIFVATKHVPWYYAIKQWFLEHKMFKYGGVNNDLHEIGHYTQMVWATSHEVGCGFAKCHGFFNYVCNYCPIGNDPETISRPYKKGAPCSKCRKHCIPKRKLCTNSCHTSDVYSNCRELKRRFPSWTCGAQRNFCKATCECGRKKIY